MTGAGWRVSWLALTLSVPTALSMPTDLLAQTGGPPIEVGGLLRTGFRAEPADAADPDGFDVFDARIRVKGDVGIVFDYFLQAELDSDEGVGRLLDARARVPILPEFAISFGLFKPPFSLEALQSKRDLTFIERSQSVTAIAPGRQVGLEVGGEAMDSRLSYGVGVFNGNGRRLENDGDDFMYTARVQFNSIGSIAFYEDFVVQVGVSVGHSDDTSAGLGAGTVTGDPALQPELTSAFAGERTFWGADARLEYRGWSLTGEYVRADYDVAPAGGVGEAAEAEAYGGYVEAGYRAFGAIEGVARYDGFHPAAGENRDFLVLGVNLYPGHYAKFGVQYGIALHDSPNGPTLAGNQFIFLAQVDF
jgi:phosphate-selective porin